MAKVTRLTLDNNGELDRRRLNFREISGDADAPLESVGQDLRKAREKRGEELEHISRLLKIRRDYLALLEEGAADSLPGRAYAIGFVRSYATYLGLDGNEYVERLKAEIAGRGDKEPQVSAAAPPPERMWLQGQWILGGLMALAAAVCRVLPDRVRHPGDRAAGPAGARAPGCRGWSAARGPAAGCPSSGCCACTGNASAGRHRIGACRTGPGCGAPAWPDLWGSEHQFADYPARAPSVSGDGRGREQPGVHQPDAPAR